ncbi:MAG TPA: hypothetical protein VMY88_03335 [Acidimicrobiales bacterium]|nr:hypothetical protein [Acidimicrobiales bacterium]
MATIGLGLALAVVGFTAMEMTGAGFSVSDNLPVDTMLAKLDEARGSILLGGGLQALVGLGIVLFGALVRRTLLRSEPEGALTPTVAWGGALVTAAMVCVAAAMTQLAGGTDKAADPAVLLTMHTLQESLFAGAWCALALTAGAVAFAGLARGSIPRWLGGVSAFIAVLLLLAQVVVPWAGWFPALIWVVVASIGLRTAGTLDASV